MFLQHPNQVFTKDMLYERVWGTAVAVDDNAIMSTSTACGARSNPTAASVHIRTVRGLGLPLCALTSAHHNIEIIPYAGLQSPAFFKKETGTFRFPFFLRKIAD